MRALIVILVALLIACDNGSTGGPSNAGGAQSEGTQDGGSTSPASGAPPQNSADAGARPDAADSPMQGSITPERLFPLAVGNQWTYSTTSFGGNMACLPGEHTTRITAMLELDGRNAFQAVLFCLGEDRFYSITDAGLETRNVDGPPGATDWRAVLPRPVVDGAVFGDDQRSLTFVGHVEVPAGTFENCWQAAWSIGTQTYCPDVGNVLTTVYDTEMGIRSELISFVLN